MRQNNFHFNRIKNDSRQSEKLMSQLYKINAELDQKRKLLERKKIQEQNLKNEFYQEPQKKPSKQYIADDKDNFFAKFERPKNQQILKNQKYRKQLDEQILTKKQSSMERNKKQAIADDLFNQLLSKKPYQIPTKQRQDYPVQFPKKNQQFQRKIQMRQQIPIKKKMLSPPHDQVNYFVKTSQQQQKRKKRQQIKQYNEALQKQIQIQNAKKKQKKSEKQLYSYNNIDFNVDIKGRKNNQLQFQKKQQKKQQKKNPINQQKQSQKEILSEKDMQLKAIFNKYKKGLIDLEEYQSTKRKIQNFYGKSNPITTTKQTIKQTQVQVVQQVVYPSQEQMPKKNYSIQNATTTQNQSKNPNNSYNPNIRGPSLVVNSSNATSQYIPNYPIPQSNLGQTQQYNDFMQQQLNFTNNLNAQMNPNHLNFQLQFMKKMFQQMKQLLKTNMLTQHQRLQETLMRGGTLPQFNYIPPPNQPYYQFPPQYQVQQQYQNIPNSEKITVTPPMQTSTPLIPQIVQNKNKFHYQQQTGEKFIGEQSLQAQNMKIPYITSERQTFFKKKYKISQFKEFEYTQDYNRENLQIPSTSCYYSAPDGKKKLKKLFDKDLVHYQKLKIEKQVQLKKQKQKSQDTKRSTQKISKQIIDPFKKKISTKQTKIVQEEQLKIQSNPKKKSYHQRQLAQSLQDANNNRHLTKPPIIKNQELKQIRKALFTNPLILVTKPDQMIEQKIDYQTNKKSPKYESENKYNEQIKITVSNQSDNDACQSYYQESADLNLKKQQIRSREIQKQLTVQSIQEDDKALKKESNILKVSRNRYRQTKKVKQNVLINYKPIDKKQEVKQIQNYKVYSDNQIQQDIPQNTNQDQMPHQQSQTLQSKFQESVQKVVPALPPKSKKNFQEESEVSKPPSNFTSLKQARLKAKEVKTKQKKQSQISIELIQQLQKGIMKKKEVKVNKQEIKQQKRPSIANSKQLLSMLDDMVEENNKDDEGEDGLSQYYPNDFQSYHTKSKNYRSNYKLNI